MRWCAAERKQKEREKKHGNIHIESGCECEEKYSIWNLMTVETRPKLWVCVDAVSLKKMSSTRKFLVEMSNYCTFQSDGLSIWSLDEMVSILPWLTVSQIYYLSSESVQINSVNVNVNANKNAHSHWSAS